MKKKFSIKYRILLDNEKTLENKEIKIDNCMSTIHAQIKLEEYLQKKYSNFKQLIVSDCKEDFDMFGAFSKFEDMFGKNPGFK